MAAIGSGAGAGAFLRVDTERLSDLGNQLVTVANGLPQTPPTFVETGTDPLSRAISEKIPAVEDPIHDALPKVKTESRKTAAKIVTAAGLYQTTDEQLAADYDAHRFDDGSAGGGSGRHAAPDPLT